MHVDNKLWTKGYASKQMDIYYCIEGLIECTKRAIFLLVCPSEDYPDKKNVLWISASISYCIKNTLLNVVKIGGRQSNVHSLSIPNAKLTKSENTFGEEKNLVSSYFFLARPYNGYCEDESFDELFSALNYSQWVEPADHHCLVALLQVEGKAINDYVTASQCGYEFLMVSTVNNEKEEKKNTTTTKSEPSVCNHTTYFIPEVLISEPIDWKNPFRTTIEYTIKKKKKKSVHTEPCILCLFSKYLMRDKRYKDVVRIAPPFCHLLANN